MSPPSSNATRSKSHRSTGKSDATGGEPVYDWAALVPLDLHPLKVAIVEALSWIGTPLSASDLNKALNEQFGVSLVSHHVRCLAELGALEERSKRQVRGATEHFYFFSAQHLLGDPGLEAA